MIAFIKGVIALLTLLLQALQPTPSPHPHTGIITIPVPDVSRGGSDTGATGLGPREILLGH